MLDLVGRKTRLNGYCELVDFRNMCLYIILYDRSASGPSTIHDLSHNSSRAGRLISPCMLRKAFFFKFAHLKLFLFLSLPPADPDRFPHLGNYEQASEEDEKNGHDDS